MNQTVKKAEYMSYHLGREFEELSQVLPDGGFMWKFEYGRGLVHVNTLRDDYYVFDRSEKLGTSR